MMNLFRRRMLLRGTQHCPTRRLKNACTTASLILLGALATFVLTDWSLIVAARQTLQEQRNTRECLDVLEGNVRMIDPDTGEVAEVKWIKLKPM